MFPFDKKGKKNLKEQCFEASLHVLFIRDHLGLGPKGVDDSSPV